MYKCPKCLQSLCWYGDNDDGDFTYYEYYCPDCEIDVTISHPNTELDGL